MCVGVWTHIEQMLLSLQQARRLSDNDYMVRFYFSKKQRQKTRIKITSQLVTKLLK